MNQSPLFALVTALPLLVGSGSAPAQAPHGAFILRNDSNVTLSYQVKWGENGPWRNFTVAPHARMSHWHPLDSYGLAPVPYVRFDYIGGDPYVNYKSYRMEFYSVWNIWSGLPYVFRFAPGGVYLDLYRD